MRSGVIYLYTFPNGKVYVGQTRRSPKIRHREHFDSNIGPLNGAFWKAFQEQGEPTFEILECIQHEDIDTLVKLLNERETYYIDKYKAADPNYGYNIKTSGTASTHSGSKIMKVCDSFFLKYKHTIWPEYEEMKKKIGQEETMTEHEKELYNAYFVEDNPFYGCKKEDKDDGFFYYEWLHFADISLEYDLRTIVCEYVHDNAAELLENYFDNDTIYQLDKDGNIIAKFDSQADAAAVLEAATTANINNVILGKQESAYGYKWVRAIDYKPSSQLSIFD